MLKRIPVDQLRLGMHVEELCGSWLDHPFWRTRFLLREQRDLARIFDGGVRELWIDTGLGLDVEVASPAVPAETREPVAALAHSLSAPAPAGPAPERTTMTDELDRASRICQRAKGAVLSMFSEARMGKAIDAASAMQVVGEINDSVARNPGALVSLARLKTADEYTFMHSVAVCGLMISLGRQLELDEAELREAGLAGLLHDMGKALVPLEILNKPGRLTGAEFAVVREHPALGHRLLLEGGTASQATLDVCLHHHERTDGAGYPNGLGGERISLFARMGAVCDVYDAITSNRPYKAGWNPAESIRKMAEWTKGQFDERVFHAFVKSVGIYPVGSLVRMTSGRLGVVVEQGGSSLVAPRVKVFYSSRSDARIPIELVDLAHRSETDRIAGFEPADRWKFRDLDEIWAGDALTQSRVPA